VIGETLFLGGNDLKGAITKEAVIVPCGDDTDGNGAGDARGRRKSVPTPARVAGLEILQSLKLNADEDAVLLLVNPLNLSPDNSDIQFPGIYVLKGNLIGCRTNRAGGNSAAPFLADVHNSAFVQYVPAFQYGINVYMKPLMQPPAPPSSIRNAAYVVQYLFITAEILAHYGPTSSGQKQTHILFIVKRLKYFSICSNSFRPLFRVTRGEGPRDRQADRVSRLHEKGLETKE